MSCGRLPVFVTTILPGCLATAVLSLLIDHSRVPKLAKRERSKSFWTLTVPDVNEGVAVSAAVNAENVPNEPATPRAPTAATVAPSLVMFFMRPLGTGWMDLLVPPSASHRRASGELREKRVR